MRGQILEPSFEIFALSFLFCLFSTHVLETPILQPFFKYHRSPYNQTFFVRTSNNGQPIGDTSNMFGHEQDFVFDYDKTCNDQGNGKKTGRGYRGYGEKIQHSKLMEFMFCLLTFQTQ